jgi:DNA-binding NarL/FixJ family response regulator
MSRQKQIFIVEDNEVFSMMLDYKLSQYEPYRFVRFRSGEECLENLHLEPDLVILDYGLPGMNGYETLKEIEKRRPHTHVLIFTNNKDTRLESQLLLAGADDLVQKQDKGEQKVAEKIKEILSRDETRLNAGYWAWMGTAVAGLVVLFFVIMIACGVFV